MQVVAIPTDPFNKPVTDAYEPSVAYLGVDAHAVDVHLSVEFQSQPMHLGRNGVTLIEYIQVAIDRLKGFNTGPLICRENARANSFQLDPSYWAYRKTLKAELVVFDVASETSRVILAEQFRELAVAVEASLTLTVEETVFSYVDISITYESDLTVED